MKQSSSFSKQMATYVGVLSALVGYPGVCIGVGLYLSRKFSWPDWVIIIPVLIGITGAFLQIYRLVGVMDGKGSDSPNDDENASS